MRYPSAANGNEEKRLHDLAPDICGGQGAYWCMFAKDDDWKERLLETPEKLDGNR